MCVYLVKITLNVKRKCGTVNENNRRVYLNTRLARVEEVECGLHVRCWHVRKVDGDGRLGGAATLGQQASHQRAGTRQHQAVGQQSPPLPASQTYVSPALCVEPLADLGHQRRVMLAVVQRQQAAAVALPLRAIHPPSEIVIGQ